MHLPSVLPATWGHVRVWDHDVSWSNLLMLAISGSIVHAVAEVGDDVHYLCNHRGYVLNHMLKYEGHVELVLLITGSWKAVDSLPNILPCPSHSSDNRSRWPCYRIAIPVPNKEAPFSLRKACPIPHHRRAGSATHLRVVVPVA